MANITDSLNVDDFGEILSNKSYCEFLRAVSNFHTYSRRNILLIFKQMPHATNVASFDSWKNQYNRTIIRDSKSIRILSPVPTEPQKKLIEKIDPTTGSPKLDGKGKIIFEDSFLPSSPKFKEISVFDITQTRGSPVLKLVDGIADNEALSGAFFDSLKIVFATSTVSDGTAQTLSQTIKNLVEACNLAKNSTFPQVGERLAAESVAYVICLRFGIVPADTAFEYIAENAEEILPYFGEILDTVRAEASKIITSLEENFKRLCEERSVNPMTEYAPEAKAAEIKPSEPSVIIPAKIITQIEPLIEPSYNVALRTEKTAFGVDFTHYDVLPVKPVFELAPKKSTERTEPQSPPPAKLTPAPQIFIPRKQIPPDPLITIADREQYGYTRCQELLPLTKDRAIALFARDMSIYLLHADNRERMVSDLPEIEAHSGIFGVPHMEWYNSREYLALASGNPEAQKEATFVDTPKVERIELMKPSARNRRLGGFKSA